MGKKRIVKSNTGGAEGESQAKTKKASAKKHFDFAILNVEATYNNTKLVLSDPKGNVLCWSTSGALGFSGAKKGTPFAAAKVGELICDKAKDMGVREVQVIVKGIGSGRESSIRSFISKGVGITSIKDVTPIPHNGPRPKKPRRV